MIRLYVMMLVVCDDVGWHWWWGTSCFFSLSAANSVLKVTDKGQAIQLPDKTAPSVLLYQELRRDFYP